MQKKRSTWGEGKTKQRHLTFLEVGWKDTLKEVTFKLKPNRLVGHGKAKRGVDSSRAIYRDKGPEERKAIHFQKLIFIMMDVGMKKDGL